MASAMARGRSHYNKNQDYKVPKPLVLLHAPASANYLLSKSPIGKARPPIYDLPGPEFVYGRKIEKTSEGNATHSSKDQHPSPTTDRPTYDYVSMNRASAKEGIITAKATREFRKKHPSCIKRGNRASAVNRKDHPKCGWLPSDKNPAYVYGKPSAESTPVADLLTDIFTRNWLEEQRLKLEERAQKEKDKHRRPKMMNKMLQSRPPPKKKAVVEIAPHELFKIKRFAAVDHKVETHWNADPNNAYRKMIAEDKTAKKVIKDKTNTPQQSKDLIEPTVQDENISIVTQKIQELDIEKDPPIETVAYATVPPIIPQVANPFPRSDKHDSLKPLDPMAIYRQRPAGKVNPDSVKVEQRLNLLSWD